MQKLGEMGVNILPVKEGKKQYDVVGEGDVVVLSAFGAPVEEMQLLAHKNVEIVDTTCPWVSKVFSKFYFNAFPLVNYIIYNAYFC